jgi:hypothetical protein
MADFDSDDVDNIVDKLTSLSANLFEEAANISNLIQDHTTGSSKSELAHGQCQVSVSVLHRVLNTLSKSAREIAAMTGVNAGDGYGRRDMEVGTMETRTRGFSAIEGSMGLDASQRVSEVEWQQWKFENTANKYRSTRRSTGAREEHKDRSTKDAEGCSLCAVCGERGCKERHHWQGTSVAATTEYRDFHPDYCGEDCSLCRKRGKRGNCCGVCFDSWVHCDCADTVAVAAAVAAEADAEAATEAAAAAAQGGDFFPNIHTHTYIHADLGDVGTLTSRVRVEAAEAAAVEAAAAAKAAAAKVAAEAAAAEAAAAEAAAAAKAAAKCSYCAFR